MGRTDCNDGNVKCRGGRKKNNEDEEEVENEWKIWKE